jgi:hypothetical protein
VIVASLPVTPDPAVAGPFTGGQNVAHWPLHLDVVEVSRANQYSVKPLALVSTVTPPIVVVFSALPLAAAAFGVVVAGAACPTGVPPPGTDGDQGLAAVPELTLGSLGAGVRHPMQLSCQAA